MAEAIGAAVARTNGDFEYKVVHGPDIDDKLLKSCAVLFSNNYGTWASIAPAPLKPGARVKMSAAKLRQECMPNLEQSVLSLCFLHGALVGHACATKWAYNQGRVGWVTQLVVDAQHRRKNIATEMIQLLRRHPWFKDITIMGIASSHPAACNALCKLFNGSMHSVDLRFMRQHAEAVLARSTPRFLRNAPVRGAYLGVPGGAYAADTSFYVDHAEPLGILQTYIEAGKWPFGELSEGHEFLVLLAVPAYPDCVENTDV